MLSSEHRAIVTATVPLLETGGELLTTHFYKMLLDGNPEVRALFNFAHQASGAQARALANAVLMYARNIERLEALGPLASQIVNKHVSLQVLPEHYPIVGRCLLASIREVLGEEIATDAVLEAWGAAYQQLADILIDAERQAYDQMAAVEGGWRGAHAFRVVRKVRESAIITSFHLEPVDGGAVMAFKPGQFIGLRLRVNGQEIRRNYSLSAAPNGHSYRISVKREADGLASGYLHDNVAIGDELELFPPAGNFTLSESERPLVLISGGVGITPTLAMLEHTLNDNQRPVVFIHYARDPQVAGFVDQLEQWRDQHPQLQSFLVYENADAGAGRQPDAIGRPSLEHLQQWLPANRDVDAYLLGPVPFMAQIRRNLRELGVPEAQTHHEFFGPAQALA